MPDKYPNFARLAEDLVEGADYRICLQRQASAVVIVAPHGGTIEPTTSRIARALAADASNLYCFEALQSHRARDLHITSTNFDEPRFAELVADCSIAVSLHGLAAERLDEADILAGGRDTALRDAICRSLMDAGFRAAVAASGAYAGTDPRNLCNRTKSGAGVQLEICRGLRDRLAADDAALNRFARAVQAAIDAACQTRGI
jgi:phage replication-related protein YjqB (UPF0714/DUF867 family)